MHNLCLASCIDSYELRCTSSYFPLRDNLSTYTFSRQSWIEGPWSRIPAQVQTSARGKRLGVTVWQFFLPLHNHFGINANLHDSSFEVSTAFIAVTGTLAQTLWNDSYVFVLMICYLLY